MQILTHNSSHLYKSRLFSTISLPSWNWSNFKFKVVSSFWNTFWTSITFTCTPVLWFLSWCVRNHAGFKSLSVQFYSATLWQYQISRSVPPTVLLIMKNDGKCTNHQYSNTYLELPCSEMRGHNSKMHNHFLK